MRARILCYGDSLTAGYHEKGATFDPYGRSLADLLDAEVVIIGKSGWTAAQLADERPGIDSVLDEYDAVIIMAGTNDLGMLCDRNDCCNLVLKIWELHTACHVRGCKSIAVSIPESGWQKINEKGRVYRGLVNEFLKEKCQESGGSATYVECPVEYDSESGFWDSDGLHMNKAGYEELARHLCPHVRSLVK